MPEMTDASTLITMEKTSQVAIEAIIDVDVFLVNTERAPSPTGPKSEVSPQE